MLDDLQRKLLMLRPAALLSVVLTLAVFMTLLVCISRLNIRGRGSKTVGLFVGLGGRSAVLMALAWVKFVMLTAVLLLGQPAGAPHFALLISLIAVFLVLLPTGENLLTELVGSGLLIAGLALCGTMLNYLRQIRYEVTIRVAYWILSVFLILCAMCVFLREVTAISEVRSYLDETTEDE